jgi:hypothetical protein
MKTAIKPGVGIKPAKQGRDICTAVCTWCTDWVVSVLLSSTPSMSHAFHVQAPSTQHPAPKKAAKAAPAAKPAPSKELSD